MLSAFGFVPVRHLGDAEVPAGWSFIVATSGVAASKAGGARDRYNRASLASRALHELWLASGRGAPTLAAALAAPGAASAFEALIDESSAVDFTAEQLRKRLAHFVEEDGRIMPAVAAFRHGEISAIRELAAASQLDAEHLLGNQIDETSALARLASDAGALAATSFGAGFGGSVWALASSDEAAGIAREWLAAYRAEYPAAGASAQTFVARPGAGLLDLSAT
jgi:galactokinase